MGCNVLGCLLSHGGLSLPCNHPPVVPRGCLLLPAMAHRQAAEQGGQEGAASDVHVGSTLVGHPWEDAGIISHLQRSFLLFQVGCFVGAEKGKGGNHMSGMSGAVEAPIWPAADSERE